MSREFWPPWLPVDEWFSQAAPYMELALDYLWFWIFVLLLPFLAWDSLVRRGKPFRKLLDAWADLAANPVRWRHLLFLLAPVIILARVEEDPLEAFLQAGVLLWLAIALASRHETLQYYRRRGIDPYDKKQVKEDRERVRRELREKGIIPPDN